MKKLALALLLALPLASAKADIYETKNFTIYGSDISGVFGAIYTPTTFAGSYTINLTTLAGEGYLYNVPGYYSYGSDYSSSPGGSAITAFSMTEKVTSTGQQIASYGLSNIASYSLGLQVALNTSQSLSTNVADSYSGYLSLNGGSFTMDLLNKENGPYAQSYGNVAAVPEPSSYVMGFAGLLGMIGFASSRKKKAAAINAPALLA